MNGGRRRTAWSAAAFFAAASVAMTWPLVRRLDRYVSDPGDPFLNAWILHWDWKQLFRDPFRLFDGNIFYPARLTLAFSENLFGAAIFGFPFYFAGLSPITVYNVLFLLGFALSGFGAWALARELTGDAVAALLAGAAYAFAPFRFNQDPHLQMQWAGWIPLAVLFLWRYLGSARRRDLALFTVFFVANAWTCVYYAIFGAIAVAVTLAVRRPEGRTRRSLARPLGLALAAALLAIAPLYAPYVLAARRYRFHRSLGETMSYSAGPTSFLSAGAGNKLWGGITRRFEKPEGQLFPGIVVLLLSAGAWVRIRRRPRPGRAEGRRPPPRALDVSIALLLLLRLVVAAAGGVRIGPLRIHEPYRLSFLIFLLVLARLAIAFPRFSRYANLADFAGRNRATAVERWAIAMIATGVVVALGARAFLYREIAEIVPFVFGAIRAPARAIVLADLGLGVLAARFAARRSRAAAMLVLALMLFELRAAPISWYEADPEPPPAIAWTDARRPPGGVLELPMKPSDDLWYVLWATAHDFPIVNGYSGFFPKRTEEIRAALTADAAPSDALTLLRRAGVSTILFHRGRASDAEQAALGRFLSAGIAGGGLVPVGRIGRGAKETIVLAAPGAAAAFSPSIADRAAVLDALAHPIRAPVAPEGWYDAPNNGDVIRGSTVRGSGWAASPDGIGRIAVILDGRDVGSASFGGYRPDVRHVKPYVSCGDYCGYRFRIDGVPPGRHTIEARFTGRNGGTNAPPAVEIRVWK